MKLFALLPAVLIACSTFLPNFTLAGSATWNQSPTSGEWNSVTNWTPATVPNGPDDAATFGTSSITTVNFEFQPFNEIAEIIFNPGASAFTFNVAQESLNITGAGITNLSETVQNFVLSSPRNLNFFNNATAGDRTNFTIEPSSGYGLWFLGGNAGSGIYNVEGGPIPGGYVGHIYFQGGTAADALFNNYGGHGPDSPGGVISVFTISTAGNAIFTNYGGIGVERLADQCSLAALRRLITLP